MVETTQRYEPPSITEYGKFEEITKQGKGSKPADGNDKQPPGQA